jgi:hypothetical protein
LTCKYAKKKKISLKFFFLSTIRQIQLNQSPAYAFPVVEPIHTFLMVFLFSIN